MQPQFVPYKLFVIGGLNTYLIDDIIPYIKKLWLLVETIVIEPPSLEEWERNQVFYENPVYGKRDRYVLMKHNIMYVEFIHHSASHTGTYRHLTDTVDPIRYCLNYVTLGVNFHKSVIDINKLYYNTSLFDKHYSDQLVPFYYFHCNVC
jgi:hypothetical protein